MAMSREASGGGRQVIDAVCVGALALLLALSASAIARTRGPVLESAQAASGSADCDTAVKPASTHDLGGTAGAPAAGAPAAGGAQPAASEGSLAALSAIAPCGDGTTPGSGGSAAGAAATTSGAQTPGHGDGHGASPASAPAGAPAQAGPAPSASAQHP